MNKHAGALRNDSRAWIEVTADDNSDAMIAAISVWLARLLQKD